MGHQRGRLCECWLFTLDVLTVSGARDRSTSHLQMLGIGVLPRMGIGPTILWVTNGSSRETNSICSSSSSPCSPFPYPGHIHLPYSIEKHCLPTPYTPPDERNNSVLLLAKRSSYFNNANAPQKTFYQDLSDDVQVDLLTTANFEEGHDIPDGLITIPATSREGYAELLGSVKALLGIGLPVISPSVYTALCQGTPVVIPQFVEDPRTDGWFLYEGWVINVFIPYQAYSASDHFQHGPAQMIGPPYVYSYYVKNYTQMQEAVKMAIETPIERYILPEMKHEYGLQRMREYLDRDVQGMYEQVLRENGGEIPRLQANVREQCYKIKACPAVFPPGRKPSAPPRAVTVSLQEPSEDV